MSFVLSRHTLVIAAIAIPYFGGMAGLFAYLCSQVRIPSPGAGDEQDQAAAELELAA